MKQLKILKKQAGVTLIELIVGLVIIALIVTGALSLFGTAQSSQASTQMLQDLTAIQSTTRGLFMGQGGYGTSGTNLNSILITAKRVPTTFTVNAATLTHQLNGTVSVASTGTGFTVTLTNIPADVCVPLVTGAQNWISVTAGTAAAITTFPATAATAATNCATGTTMVFAGS